jgi:4-hydroxy-4-methyl-2-oxoglutarate aldolase
VRPAVFTGPPRPPSDVVARLGEHGVATVHEARGRLGLLGTDLRPVWPGARTAGSAVTALCPPGDNLTVHLAIEQTGPGDLLVITTTSPCSDGYIGELIATSLNARGVTGLVTTTGLRDVRDITAARFPAWSRSISAQGTAKDAVGQVNCPVMIADTVIRPGDVIVADDDGVACVPREAVTEVLTACDEWAAREASAREQLRDGALTLDVFNLRPLVHRLDVQHLPWSDSGYLMP